MYAFEYERAQSLETAAASLKADADCVVMAGGQTLLPTLKLRLASPSKVIDLAAVSGLDSIEKSADAITIGAMARHASVASSADVKGAIPALAYLAGLIGDPQVRNRGTMGGSVANSDPAADYPAAVLGLGATINTTARAIAADDYFKAMFETALDAGELIRSISFPIPQAAAYAKFPNPASRYALVGVFVARTGSGVRVAVTGAGPCAFRATELENALNANFSASSLDGVKVSAANLNEDVHAQADYRAHLVTVMAQRAVAACG